MRSGGMVRLREDGGDDGLGVVPDVEEGVTMVRGWSGLAAPDAAATAAFWWSWSGVVEVGLDRVSAEDVGGVPSLTTLAERSTSSCFDASVGDGCDCCLFWSSRARSSSFMNPPPPPLDDTGGGCGSAASCAGMVDPRASCCLPDPSMVTSRACGSTVLYKDGRVLWSLLGWSVAEGCSLIQVACSPCPFFPCALSDRRSTWTEGDDDPNRFEGRSGWMDGRMGLAQLSVCACLCCLAPLRLLCRSGPPSPCPPLSVCCLLSMEVTLAVAVGVD